MNALYAVASRLDELPFLPHNLADRAMGRFFDRRRVRAQEDPTWTEIEKRRVIAGSTSKLVLSEERGLTMKDWLYQNDIAVSLTPDPRWLPFARKVRHWTPSRVVAETTHQVQRFRRGFSDADTWDLATFIPEQIAACLDVMADNAHGWPESEEFPTFDDWVAALRSTATSLRRAGADPLVNEATRAWHDANRDPNVDPELTEELFRRSRDVEAARDDEVDAAFLWVVEHRQSLWN